MNRVQKISESLYNIVLLCAVLLMLHGCGAGAGTETETGNEAEEHDSDLSGTPVSNEPNSDDSISFNGDEPGFIIRVYGIEPEISDTELQIAVFYGSYSYGEFSVRSRITSRTKNGRVKLLLNDEIDTDKFLPYAVSIVQNPDNQRCYVETFDKTAIDGTYVEGPPEITVICESRTYLPLAIINTGSSCQFSREGVVFDGDAPYFGSLNKIDTIACQNIALDPDVFVAMTNTLPGIKHVSLIGTELSDSDMTMFLSKIYPNTLSLANNELTNLDFLNVHSQGHIISLDLSGNDLQVVEPAIRNLSLLSDINLSGNDSLGCVEMDELKTLFANVKIDVPEACVNKYVVSPNLGSVVIENGQLLAGRYDRLLLSGEIDPSLLSVSKSGDDRILETSSGTRITIKDWDLTASNKITHIEMADETLVELESLRDNPVKTTNLSSGDDVFAGDGGGDEVHGLDGDDILTGGDGDDRLFGGDGDDFLFGNDGNDILESGDGRDNLLGGAGSDTYIINKDGRITIREYAISEDTDRIRFMDLAPEDLIFSGTTLSVAGNNYLSTGNTSIEIYSGGSLMPIEIFEFENDGLIEEITYADYVRQYGMRGRTVYGGPLPELILASDRAGTTHLDGGAGDDIIQGFDGHDSIYGGEGDDILYGGDGDNFLDGGTGSDTYVFDLRDSYEFGCGSTYIQENMEDAGEDRIRFIKPNAGDPIATDLISYISYQRIFISYLNCEIRLTDNGSFLDVIEFIEFEQDGQVETLSYQDFLNQYGLRGYDYSNDTLTGIDLGEYLGGNGGDDLLYGNGGDDILEGGDGNDWLEGGAGGDTYLFSKGHDEDTIVENESDEGDDRIRFKGIYPDELLFVDQNTITSKWLYKNHWVSGTDKLIFDNEGGAAQIEFFEFENDGILQVFTFAEYMAEYLD